MKRKNILELTTELILSDHRTCHALHRQTVMNISKRHRRLSQYPPPERGREVLITRRRLRAQNTKKRTANQHTDGKEGLSRWGRGKLFQRATNRRMENNRETHTQTHKHTHNRIIMKMVPMGQSSPVYLPYSLRVLQRAGRARPRLKDDTHGPAFPSKPHTSHLQTHTHKATHAHTPLRCGLTKVLTGLKCSSQREPPSLSVRLVECQVCGALPRLIHTAAAAPRAPTVWQ